MRSNRDEFLSFLGTCLTFYEQHLTPYEQKHTVFEIGEILREHVKPDCYSTLVRAIYGGTNDQIYQDTDSVMEGGDTDVHDAI